MSKGKLRAARIALALACGTPLMLLLARAFELGGITLGANPIETLLHTCGKTALNLLMLTLGVTPLRRLTGLNWVVSLRRMLGLFAFFYAALHFAIYVGLDRQPWDWLALRDDLLERPYITLGFTALLLMVPLAATSTAAMQKRLGRRWKRLHRLVYLTGVLAVTHYWWQAKRDPYESLLYAALLALLLGLRLVDWRRRHAGTGALSRS